MVIRLGQRGHYALRHVETVHRLGQGHATTPHHLKNAVLLPFKRNLATLENVQFMVVGLIGLLGGHAVHLVAPARS